mgnify:CR=1 FL=1
MSNTTDDELLSRFKKLTEGDKNLAKPIPTEEELHDRLNHLSDGQWHVIHHLKPNINKIERQKTEQEEIDELLNKVADETTISETGKKKISDDELYKRFYHLVENTASPVSEKQSANNEPAIESEHEQIEQVVKQMKEMAELEKKEKRQKKLNKQIKSKEKNIEATEGMEMKRKRKKKKMMLQIEVSESGSEGSAEEDETTTDSDSDDDDSLSSLSSGDN